MILLIALACGGGAPAEPPLEAPAEARVDEEPPQEPILAPPSPVEIRVVNAGEAPLELDLSFGPTAPFRVSDLDTPEASLSLDQPDGTWSVACDCPCDPESACPECEPPVPVVATLPPGEDWSLSWNGQLRRWSTDADGERCFTSFAPAGRFRLQACGKDGRCGTVAEVGLPASDTVEIRIP